MQSHAGQDGPGLRSPQPIRVVQKSHQPLGGIFFQSRRKKQCSKYLRLKEDENPLRITLLFDHANPATEPKCIHWLYRRRLQTLILTTFV